MVGERARRAAPATRAAAAADLPTKVPDSRDLDRERRTIRSRRVGR